MVTSNFTLFYVTFRAVSSAEIIFCTGSIHVPDVVKGEENRREAMSPEFCLARPPVNPNSGHTVKGTGAAEI